MRQVSIIDSCLQSFKICVKHTHTHTHTHRHKHADIAQECAVCSSFTPPSIHSTHTYTETDVMVSGQVLRYTFAAALQSVAVAVAVRCGGYCSAMHWRLQGVAVAIAVCCTSCCRVLHWLLQCVAVPVAVHRSGCCGALQWLLRCIVVAVVVAVAMRCSACCSALQCVAMAIGVRCSGCSSRLCHDDFTVHSSRSSVTRQERNNPVKTQSSLSINKQYHKRKYHKT